MFRLDTAPTDSVDLANINLPKIDETKRKRFIPVELLKPIENTDLKNNIDVEKTIEFTSGRIRINRGQSV